MIKKTGVKNRRLLFAKNSIIMLVMLVIIFLAVFAWYYVNRNVSATGISVSAANPEEVQIALPGSNDMMPIDSYFTDNINFSSSDYCTKLVKDVTSDGHQFVVPTFDTTDSTTTNINGKTVLTAGDWTKGLSSREALKNSDESDNEKFNYISVDFYLRSSSPNISLVENSYLAAYSELQTGSNAKISSNAYDESAKFGFSTDALVGAMRVSLEKFDVAYTGTTENAYPSDPPASTPSLLWLPRPDIYVDTTHGAERTWTLTDNVKPSDVLAATTYRHTFYRGDYVNNNTVKRGVTKTTYYDSGVTSGSSFSSGATDPGFFKVTKIPSSDYSKLGTAEFYPTFGQRAQVASGGNLIQTSATRFQKDWYIYRMRLNVWIEGADAEARRAMNEGQFKLYLEFN